jgi:hypothetical protein
MAGNQEFPVEVYYIKNGNGLSEICLIGFKTVGHAEETVPDLFTNPNWIDVNGDRTRFESRSVYEWLRKD